MKAILIASLMGLVLGTVTFSQDPTPPQKPTQFQFVVQTRPIAIPTGLTTVINQTAYICGADFTATGQNILVEDLQSTPIAWINNVLGSSGSPSTFIFNATQDSQCRYFPNGIQWQAGATGATGYLTIKCAASPCKLASGF